MPDLPGRGPSCTACGDWADYTITTGTETVHVCAAELVSFIEAALDNLGEPFVAVRKTAPAGPPS